MKLKSQLAYNASASQVKKQMQACSETKMKAVLNSDQKEQLKNNMMQGSGVMKGGMMNQGQGGMMQNQNNHHGLREFLKNLISTNYNR